MSMKPRHRPDDPLIDRILHTLQGIVCDTGRYTQGTENRVANHPVLKGMAPVIFGKISVHP